MRLTGSMYQCYFYHEKNRLANFHQNPAPKLRDASWSVRES